MNYTNTIITDIEFHYAYTHFSDKSNEKYNGLDLIYFNTIMYNLRIKNLVPNLVLLNIIT
jgi:hypothetical protein